MSITLHTIDSSIHSIEVKSAGGTALALDGSGYITSNINGVVSIDDNAGSITVDGTVAATQSGSWDIGTVTTLTGITNDVNIADGGNSITVDGTVAATQSGSWDIGTVSTITNVVSVDDNAGSLTVDGTVAATQSGSWSIETTPASFSSWLVTQDDITSSESEIVSTPLSNRLRILVQNVGGADAYIRESTGVSTSNGLKLVKGSSYEADLDAGANLFAITAGGTADFRIVEYAA